MPPKLRTIILEDSPENLELLSSYLSDDCPQIEVVGISPEVKEGIALIEALNPDLLLLDIQLRGGTSFDVIDYLTQRGAVGFQIIFMTGFGNEDSSTRALRMSALDYLRKPLNRNELREAIEKAQKQRIELEQLRNFIESMRSKNAQTHIAIDVGEGNLQWVEIRHIQHLEAAGGITVLHVFDDHVRKITKINGRKRLGEYEPLLTKDHPFLRVHDRYVVNLQHIYKYNQREGEIRFRYSEKPILAATRLKTILKNQLQHPPVPLQNFESNTLLDLLKRWFR